MERLQSLIRNNLRELSPCVHGGEVAEVARALRFEEKGILDFSSNVNPLGPSPKAVEAIKDNLWRIPYYPDPSSNLLREALSEYIGSIGPDNVIIGNGSTELIHLFSEAFIREGEEALIPEPTFGEYEVAVRRAGGKIKFVKSGLGFRVDAHRMLEEVGPNTKAVFLCNPNNPTGKAITQKELLKIVEGAEERGALVFLDEDFIEFTDNRRSSSLAGMVEGHWNLFVIRSFTKVFGLAGLRVGYGLACREMVKALFRAKPPWNVNCLAQVAAMAALKDESYLKESQRVIKEEGSLLHRELGKVGGFEPLPTEANFILVNIKESGLRSDQLKRELLKFGILIRDCSSFRGLDHNYIRIAIRLREDNKRLLSSLERVKFWPEGP